MLSSALLSLGVAGSALAWPSVGHPRHSSIARSLHARQEPVVKAKEPVAATWFASWHADEFSLANVSWNKYTTVSYSFALTTPNVSFVNISDPEVFKDFVSTAHANNVSATISIGGWTGSLYFSSAVATAENRTEFVKTMVNLLEDNNLDGLSFDWEYPNSAGVGCNTKSPNDTENFLLFLKELRTALPSNATLSAATSITPFISADGTPSTNVSEFASVFDYIQLMNYDIWGSWSATTGPNAPLNDTCATNATQKVGSAVSAVEAWTKAGFPADQLVLGVAGYGHGFSVAPASALTDGILNAYSPFNKNSTPPGDAWDDAPVNGTVDVCGNPQAQGGNWNFWGLIEGGFLNENGTANTAEGIAYKFDECSQTPFVYNQTSGVFVAFDNAASFTSKGQFINATGLRGFAMWEAGGDYDDILLDAIRSGAGFPEVVEDYDDCEDDDTVVTTPVTGNSSNNSGNTSGNTSGSTSTSNTSNNSGSNSSNNSGSNGSSNTSTSNTSSNSGSTSTTPNTNSGSSNNSGSNSSNNSGSSNTTPDNDDDEDCEDDEYPETTAATPTSSAKPTATASPDDDDECEDDDYTEPAVTSTVKPTTYTAKPTTYQASTTATPATPTTSTEQPATTSEVPIPDDDDDEECEDDEIIDATTSATSSGTVSATSTVSASTVVLVASTGTASVASTSTVSATFSDVTATSTVSASSSASESTVTVSKVSTTATESIVTSASVETASTAQPTATESYESSSAPTTVESTSSAPSSSHAAPTSSKPVTTDYPTSSFEDVSSAEPTSAAPSTSAEPSSSTSPSTRSGPSTHPAPSQSFGPAPTSTLATTSAAPTTRASSSAAPTISAPEPTF